MEYFVTSQQPVCNCGSGWPRGFMYYPRSPLTHSNSCRTTSTPVHKNGVGERDKLPSNSAPAGRPYNEEGQHAPAHTYTRTTQAHSLPITQAVFRVCTPDTIEMAELQEPRALSSHHLLLSQLSRERSTDMVHVVNGNSTLKAEDRGDRSTRVGLPIDTDTYPNDDLIEAPAKWQYYTESQGRLTRRQTSNDTQEIPVDPDGQSGGSPSNHSPHHTSLRRPQSPIQCEKDARILELEEIVNLLLGQCTKKEAQVALLSTEVHRLHQLIRRYNARDQGTISFLRRSLEKSEAERAVQEFLSRSMSQKHQMELKAVKDEAKDTIAQKDMKIMDLTDRLAECHGRLIEFTKASQPTSPQSSWGEQQRQQGHASPIRRVFNMPNQIRWRDFTEFVRLSKPDTPEEEERSAYSPVSAP